MPLTSWLYHQSITDSTGGSLSGAVCTLALTSANFNFSLANADGSDLRVYDETAAATVPLWLMDYDSVAQTATIFYKATLTSHAQSLYSGNAQAATVSSFSDVFTHGSGFDADWGDLTTSVAANGTATRLAKSAGKSDARERRVWKRGNTPTIAANVVGGVSIREFSIVCDQYGTITPDGSGNWIAYYSSRESDGGPIDTYRAQSADQGVTWTGHTQVLAHGAVGEVDEKGAYVGSVVKFGPTDYRMWYMSRVGSGAVSIRLATSTDNVTWTKGSVAVIAANTPAITDVVATSVGVPFVRRLRNSPNAGTWVLLCEGQPASAVWQVYMFTSPDAITWTIANGGASIFPFGGSTFYTTNTANPKLLELPDGSGYALEFNGSSFAGSSTTADDWQVGWAKSSTLTSGYAIDAGMPALARASVTYGLETSGIVFDSSGNWVHHHQDYTGDSSTAAIWRSRPIPDQGGLFVTPATTDTALAGVVLSAGTFTAQVKHWITAHRYSPVTSPIVLGLWDNATVPAGDTAANHAAKRRLEIWRQGPDATNPGIVRIVYFDGTLTRFFWTGTGWDTPSTNSFASDLSRPIMARISDDGTNFTATVTYADDGSAIAAATIAKASVHSFASSRVLIAGDPFTDNWALGHMYRYVGVRPYVAVEPILSLGAQQQSPATAYAITAPTPDSGFANNASANFTVTPNGTYSGTVTLTPSGGGLSAPIVLTWTASSTPTTFTLTPRAAGVITLTPVSSPVLTDPAPATYTANPQTLSVGPLTLTVNSPQTVNFQGGGTVWSHVTPTFSVSGPGAAGTTVGVATITSDTACTALVTPGLTAGSLTFTDGSTGATASATIASAPVSAATGWNYLSSVSTFAAGLVGSVGYTVLHSDGSIQAARSMQSVFAVGSVAYVAAVPLPITGAFVILWDDGSGHQSIDIVSPRGCEPPSARQPGGLTVEQAIAEALAVLTGISQGFTRGALSTPTYFAPDGVTPRVTGTEDVSGNRTGIVLIPPQ